ncbi:vanillyl-alcohol oxidase [Colletotrichum incanum]|uniref:Vanillyl-alcohol oxidase n=1 Tax=Colletotrichum incanum TaxID=1573173 RepID=A0A161Y1T0_COLIC|nr:vanillyl-alcohol oxidase [Colletotrichum incanum]
MAPVPEPIGLPPNFTLELFQKFVVRAQEICGVENVRVVPKDKPLEGDSYLNQPKSHDHFPLYEKTKFVASAVVTPRHVPDVQALVALCNDLVMPVWPISLGRNFGYGGASPRVPGSVVMDLGHHMNRILEVNVEGAYVLLEPGVSFRDLHEHLEKHNLREHLWLSVPVGQGSVLGNAVERGVGATPYGDHWGMHCGMEVVLPNGKLVRTGMGGVPNPNADPSLRPDEQPANETWQLFNTGYGPYNDGLFSQSNLGIVTKIGMWLMPNPGGYQPYEITFENDSDLPKVVDIIRPLRLQMVLQNVPFLRHTLLNAAHCGPKSKYTNKEGPMSEEEVDAVAKQLDMGRWQLIGAVYGPKPVRDVLLSVIKHEFLSIPGSRFFLPEDRARESPLRARELLMQGIPTVEELRCLNWLPNGGQLLWAPISKVSGQDAKKQHDVAKNLITSYGFDYLGAFAVGMRELHHVIGIPYRLDVPEDVTKIRQLAHKLIKETTAHGWGQFRAHTALMDPVADAFNWNDNAQMQLNETIKNALDPNGIIAPGKNGVWPANYDKKKWVLDAKRLERSRPSTSHRSGIGGVT